MTRKFTAKFDEFAQWYIGDEQCTAEEIIEYFEQEMDQDVRPFIGKSVEFIEKPHRFFEYRIEGTSFIADAVDQFI